MKPFAALAISALTAVSLYAQQAPGPKIRPLKTLKGHSAGVDSLFFSPDQKHLLSGGSGDDAVRLWDPATGAQAKAMERLQGYSWRVTFTPDGSKIVAISPSSHMIRIWDRSTGKEVKKIDTGSFSVNWIRFTRDGKQAITAGCDLNTSPSEDGGIDSHCLTTQIRLWRVPEWTAVWEIKPPRNEAKRDVKNVHEITSVDLSPDGRSFATGSLDGSVQIRDLATGNLIRSIAGQGEGVQSVAFSPDGRRIAFAGQCDGDVYECKESASFYVGVADLSSGEITRLVGHTEMVNAIAFHPAGGLLFSSGQDDTIRAWDVERGEGVATVEAGQDGVYTLAFSADGKRLASGGNANTITIWSVGE